LQVRDDEAESGTRGFGGPTFTLGVNELPKLLPLLLVLRRCLHNSFPHSSALATTLNVLTGIEKGRDETAKLISVLSDT